MSTSAIRKVGIVGLGKMGLPMARHIAKAGFEVHGLDIDPQTQTAARAAGMTLASTPAALAAVCDFVIVVVGFDDEAMTVILGSDGLASGAHAGLIVGVASTVAPSTMQKLARRVAGSGISLIDMPITRGEWAAEAAQLLVMAGGDKAAFERCRPVLACFSDAIFHVGDLGAGQVGKMVNNLILWACISANDEAFKIADKLGVDRETLRAALLESSAGNWALKVKPEEQPMPWAEKDMRILLAEADKLRLPVPLAGVVAQTVKTVKIERGWPTPSSGEE